MNSSLLPSTDAPPLLEPDSSAHFTTAKKGAHFRAPMASQRPGVKPGVLAGQRPGAKPGVLAGQKSRANHETSTSKGGKLKITKTDSGYEFSADAQTRFRARPESNKLRLMVRRKTDSGEWPEMYVCMLDRSEWQTIRKGTLSDVLFLIEQKIDERIARGASDPAKVAEVSIIIQNLKGE